MTPWYMLYTGCIILYFLRDLLAIDKKEIKINLK